MPNVTREAEQYAVQAAEKATEKRWVGQLARWGFLAIGIVYLLIGVLAVMGLVGLSGGQFTGSSGAARTILAQPFGRTLFGLVALGLAVFVSWRFCQAVLDVEQRGHDTWGLMQRAGLSLSGLSYAGLAVAALRYLFLGGGRMQSARDDWTATLMSYPAGAVLVGLVGLGVICTGLYQFYAAYQVGFLDDLATDLMSEPTQRWVQRLGRFGLSARGVVFSIVGWFFMFAALRSNPEGAKGLGGALRYLGQQPYGYWLIGIVAVGLFAFGTFMLAKVRYRRIASREGDEQE